MNNLNYNNNFYIYFKRFTHDTVLYGIGNLFHKLSSVAIYFIIVRNLSIENFGIFDFYMTLINFAIINLSIEVKKLASNLENTISPPNTCSTIKIEKGTTSMSSAMFNHEMPI